MQHISWSSFKNRAAAAVAGLMLLALPVEAQWKNLPMDGVPMGPDGKPNMSAPAPKTSDGKPDLSGSTSRT